MIIENNSVTQPQQELTVSVFKDFQIGNRVKKITTHDLYELKKGSQTYIAKLFKVQFRNSFEKELTALKALKHPNIIQIVYYQYSENQSMGLWNCDMIILKNAVHGSLNEYVPLNGKFSEKVARTLFKQIISGVKYAAQLQQARIIHPNLLPSSILLDEQRQVKICGWSKITDKLPTQEQIKALLFNCCEILLLMLTSYMPFYKKNSNSDPLFKFLKPTHIEKFWQSLNKRVCAKQKDFQISCQAKQLIQKIFLGEWKSFQQLQASDWMKGQTHTVQQLNKILEQKQKASILKRQQLLKKQCTKQQKKRKILEQYEEETLKGSLSRSSSSQFDFFIQDYYDNFFSQTDLPSSECSEFIRLYDNRPNFIIASFKQNLRSLEDSDINLLLGSQFKLISHYVDKVDNQAFVHLKFEQSSTGDQDQDSDEVIEIGVKSTIRFFKNNQNHLYAEVKIVESNLSQYYASLLMTFIQDKIKLIN